MTAVMQEYSTTTAPAEPLTLRDLCTHSPGFRKLYNQARAEYDLFQYAGPVDIFVRHYRDELSEAVGHSAIAPAELRTRGAYNSAVYHILGALNGAENRYREENK
jgi:CubicO group peptidase (beta-lactamase class C family)